jgi:hypothetical protein
MFLLIGYHLRREIVKNEEYSMDSINLKKIKDNDI